MAVINIKNCKSCRYPILEINLNKLYENVSQIVKRCEENSIEVAGVVKGFNSLPELIEVFIRGGCTEIATSRINQIIDFRDNIIKPFMLIRIPMLSEIKDLVKYVDISLNSELETIEEINNECTIQDKKHKVILMVDLGDLREGFWDLNELIDAACHIENNLSNVKLYGIGTNLGCYGAIKPTEDKMNELCEIAELIEEKIDRKLDIISGGATSSLPLVLQNKMPERINHLRIGEGIILARDLQDIWGLDMSYMHKDVFTLKAEIIEIRNKITYPSGEIFIDGFGKHPEYEDRGIRNRAILGIGKLDYALNDKIIPRKKGIEIIGSSSDHMIIDVERTEEKFKLGDIVEFDICYPAMMYLTNSKDILIRYT